jgi:homocysteine S-methyltransferase
MQRLKTRLPQLQGGLYLNDSGMETTLVFDEGRELPAFAALPLLEREEGRTWLTRYFGRHLALAEAHGAGFVLDTPTWRANRDWGAAIDYDAASLHRVNTAAVHFCRAIRETWAGRVAPIVIAGVLGPRGDGYRAGTQAAEEAEAYHATQIASLAAAGADMISAYTLSTVEEATGIARAAKAAGIPAAISFTVETDGKLASGTPLGEAIEAVDDATGGAPAYFMINCAHPTHFAGLLAGSPAWGRRIAGLKANASRLSHAELETMATLDAGDPDDLGTRYRALARMLPGLAVLGGCCGTDHRNVGAIARACCPVRAADAVA